MKTDLQARVKGEFRALYQTLHDEEICMLEQLMREEEEELGKVQRHLEAMEVAVKELEDNIQVLQQASAGTENIVLTEVRALSQIWMPQRGKYVHLLCNLIYLDFFFKN